MLWWWLFDGSVYVRRVVFVSPRQLPGLVKLKYKEEQVSRHARAPEGATVKSRIML